MPRDPRDISLSAPEQQTRRILENEDAARGGSRVFGQATAGAEGKEGKAGATWRSGTTVPSTALGVVGDFYLRTTTWDIYEKTAEAVWTLRGNIKGETGETGATGGEGPAGVAAMNGWKEPCRVATTANITIATALNPGDSIDGVVLAENDRVLVWKQTTKSQNGIYRVAAAPARTTDADAAGELMGGTTVFVSSGETYSRRHFTLITAGSINPGTTAHDWAPEYDAGSSSATFPGGTTTSNIVTVTHALGTAPKNVNVITEASEAATVPLTARIIEGSRTSTQFKVRLYGAVAIAAATINFTWEANL